MCDLGSHCLHLYYNCPTVIRVKDNEVDYLLTHLALRITTPFRYVAQTSSIHGPFEEDVMPNELLTYRVDECEHSGGWWYGSEARYVGSKGGGGE